MTPVSPSAEPQSFGEWFKRKNQIQKYRVSQKTSIGSETPKNIEIGKGQHIDIFA